MPYICNQKTCKHYQDSNPAGNKNRDVFGKMVKKILSKKGLNLRCPSCILQVASGKRAVKDIGVMKLK